MDDLMSVTEFSKLIKKSPRVVYQMIESGEIEAFDLRNPGSKRPTYRVRRAEAERWHRSRRVVPKSGRSPMATLKRRVCL